MKPYVRASHKECTDQTRIDDFLTKTQIGYLGLADQDIPYVIPLNFIWKEGCFFFHGASEGRKIDMIHTNPKACFTVSEQYGTMVSPIPAKTDTAYMSVVAGGTVEMVTDADEGTAVMQAMLDKYVPNYYQTPLSKTHVEKYRSSLGSKTVVWKIKPLHITAKENQLDEQKKFYPGRTVQQDNS
ncbi:pyridoxamine 5'-phosphate oxidase family protein [Bacillus sp. ISL-51]|uniref:pyridoxamine 5'-phosphate oxidase family protein n=1 Tax=Bacteria TaxID=2 RepID=UPI001BE547D3|nr:MULTISPECIES: pyridoxamine 5'-phosphate oxidase family protein [Bacteria]MBT2573908.1 pyridoxamine 5'-phosphate oxidase family protein [Bacillus sp. ISL-51]MBT2634760.1 pyridoxamine 5'-phosphate oxidase family protein [Bacillus sp. ISL-26]MBT2712236.1 pyridoxamine 5'-phosphate oxidase family protein [Pseudomonas sp. ISL-88]